jgi:regulator of protease activity HflC (stomatin/prohibitin superfamily)
MTGKKDTDSRTALLSDQDQSGAMPETNPQDIAYRALPLVHEQGTLQNLGYEKIASYDEIAYKKPHSDFEKFSKGLLGTLLTVGTAGLHGIRMINKTYLVPDGQVGIVRNNGQPEFLAPGWHYLGSAFRKMQELKNLSSETPVKCLTRGFVTVSEGKVGIAKDKGRFLLLGPGIYQWNSNSFEFDSQVAINENSVTNIGPYQLVKVPIGHVAITSDNGVLKILGEVNTNRPQPEIQASKGDARSNLCVFFLNNPNWRYVSFLPTQQHFDRLTGEAILTLDRVQVDVEANVSWVITDPEKAAKTGSTKLDNIRTIVHREAKAAITAMLGAQRISAGFQEIKARKHEQDAEASWAGENVEDDQSDNFSQTAGMKLSGSRLTACNIELQKIGVEVSSLNIVHLAIKHDDIRKKLAAVAAIPATVEEKRKVALADAETTRIEASAKSDARIAQAEGEAKAILLVAEAQRDAAKALEATPHGRALSLAEASAKTLAGARGTLFFNGGGEQGGLTPLLDVSRYMTSTQQAGGTP